ncbi:MAG: glycosyltransferase family 39 protein [Candidatus Daviesbacteria bacterium]|nr:glycosyltransferase family 39 protein [Candidatus Daviesbacteria bacterium]
MKFRYRKKLIWGSLLVIVCIFIWSFFTYRITEVPPGINSDEAAIGYNALLISRTLYDENNRFLPVFTLTLDKKDWKQPITLYSTALAFRIFGPSYELLRGVSVVFIIISFVLLFFLLKELFDLKATILGLVVFITTPILMIQSHLALENIAPVPFIVFWLLMILKYQKTQHLKYLLLAGFTLGLSFYSYNAMRLIIPVLTILTVSYIFYIKRKMDLSKVLIPEIYFLVGITPFVIILPWLNTAYPGAILGSGRPAEIISYQQFLAPYLSTFDLSFLYLKGDVTLFHSTGNQGMFLLATLPIFFLGCFKAIQSKKPFFIFVLLVFFLSPILFGLVESVYRASRLLVLLPPYVVISALGICSLFEKKRYLFKYVFTMLVLFLIFLNFLDFINDYWFSYPLRVKQTFPSTAHISFRKLYDQSRRSGLEPVVQLDIFLKENISAQFFRQLYFPDALILWKREEVLPSKAVLLVNSMDLSFSQKAVLNKVNTKMQDYDLWETK